MRIPLIHMLLAATTSLTLTGERVIYLIVRASEAGAIYHVVNDGSHLGFKLILNEVLGNWTLENSLNQTLGSFFII